MPVWLVEDSEVMNSGYSLVLDRLKSTTNVSLLFWRSPGWELDSFFNPVLSFKPTYTNSGIVNSSKHDAEVEPSAFVQQSMQDSISSVKEWLDSCSYKDKIDLRKLCESRYAGLELGRGIVSSCLRILPYTNASLKAPYTIVADLALKLIRSIHYFEHNPTLAGNIQYAFFSETVYQCSVLIEYFLKLGISCPFLYVNDGPLLLRSDHLGDRIGVSPRISASRQFAKKNLSSVELPTTKWMNRISGRKDMALSEASAKMMHIDEWGRNAANLFNLEYHSDARGFSRIIYKEHHGVFVFYLHAITDGAFLHGFSGYVTPYEFYRDIINTIIKPIRDSYPHAPLVVLRLHPNLHNGASSPYSSHRARAKAELDIGMQLIKKLVTTCRDADVPCHLCSPKIKNKYIFSTPNVVIVSHHGSVVGEAASLNISVISSCISHFAAEPDPENVFIYRRENNETMMRKLLEGLGACQQVSLSIEKLRSSLIADRYNASEFQIALGKLDALARRLGFPCFDKMIYMKNLSWDSHGISSVAPEALHIIDEYLLSFDTTEFP